MQEKDENIEKLKEFLIIKLKEYMIRGRYTLIHDFISQITISISYIIDTYLLYEKYSELKQYFIFTRLGLNNMYIYEFLEKKYNIDYEEYKDIHNKIKIIPGFSISNHKLIINIHIPNYDFEIVLNEVY